MYGCAHVWVEYNGVFLNFPSMSLINITSVFQNVLPDFLLSPPSPLGKNTVGSEWIWVEV